MKDAYWFKHDSNAKDDPKCVMLIEQLGLEGYGIYWVLVETLRDQPGYRYPLALVPALARRYNTTAQKMKTAITAYGLFESDDENFFFSNSLCDRMAVYDAKREKRRLAANVRWGNVKAIDANAVQVQCKSNASALQVQCNSNAIREEKSREDIYAQSFAQFYQKYPKKRNKQTALRSWMKLKPDADLLEKIMSSLEKHKLQPDWQKDNGQFVPYPSTWLNQRRWEDELEPARSETIYRD